MKQLYTGNVPWFGTSNFRRKVIQGERPPRPLFLDTSVIMRDDLWQIVEDCWMSDNTKRPRANDLVQRFKMIMDVT